MGAIRLKDFSQLDKGIVDAVIMLNRHGFETWESCEGGEGHCFEFPTIRFWGTEFDLIRAHRVCENYGLKIYQSSRIYRTTEISTGDLYPCPNGKVWDVPFNEIQFLERPIPIL